MEIGAHNADAVHETNFISGQKKYGRGVLEGQLHFHSLQICVGFGKTAPNIVVSSTLKSTPFLVRR